MRVLIQALLLACYTTSSWAQEKGWESKWNDLLTAAKKEGKVVVHGPPDVAVGRDLPTKFTERFGISLEYQGGRSSEAAPRLRSERKAGLYTVDVFLGGVDSISNAVYPEKMLDPVKSRLLLPEVLDSSKWKKGGVWYSDPEGIYVPRLLYYVARMFYVNTREAKLEQFKSIKELLNPRWKGKIATMDPTVLGSGLANASQLYLFGEAFVKRFYVDQKPVISRDQRQLTDWVVRGVYPIVFGARESEVEKFRQEGFPVYSVCSLPDAPGSVSAGFGAVGLMNKAPHPNAAHVFVNWLLSKEGLETYSRAYRSATTRNDVDESFLDRETIPEAGVKYAFDSGDWEYNSSAKREKLRLRIKELLGR